VAVNLAITKRPDCHELIVITALESVMRLIYTTPIDHETSKIYFFLKKSLHILTITILGVIQNVIRSKIDRNPRVHFTALEVLMGQRGSALEKLVNEFPKDVENFRNEVMIESTVKIEVTE